MSDKEKLYVVYDGECRLCIATITKLQELRTKANIQYMTLQKLRQSEQAQLVPGMEQVSEESLREKLHVADEHGHIYAGADGVIRIMRTLAGFGPLTAIYAIPGMKPIGDAVYRWVAKHRYDWFGKVEQSCSTESCHLPKPRGKGNE